MMHLGVYACSSARSKMAASTELTASTVHHPSMSFSFPKPSYGSANVQRSCQAGWFRQWPWLHYDGGKDAVFCHVCIRATNERKMTTGTGETAFVSINLLYYTSNYTQILI